MIARAFWLRAPGAGEIRPVRLPEPGPDDVLVRTLRSGIGRGTETLVFRGSVPPDQHARMRAPLPRKPLPTPPMVVLAGPTGSVGVLLLLQKNEQVRGRVEAMIGRLKGMEQVS